MQKKTGGVNFRYFGQFPGARGTDVFNRANGALGPNWTYFTQGSGVQAQIIANQYAASALHQSEWTTAPINIRKGFVQCTWVGYTSVAWGGPMCFRHTSGANQECYSIEVADLGGGEPRAQLRILRLRAAVFTTIATASPIVLSGFAFGTPLRLDWEVQPTQVLLTASVNGIQQCQGADATAQRFTSGRPGICITTTSGGTANAWDNFSYASLSGGGGIREFIF